MITTCFDVAAESDRSDARPRDRIVLNTASATCKVRSTPLPFLLGGLNILAISWSQDFAHTAFAVFRCKGPLREPIVLTAAQRDALGANPA
jgi:hypothetical protein